MEKTEAGAEKRAPLHDLHQDQVDAGRYRAVRAYVLGCDNLELEHDNLEEENEDLRDMLNDIAFRLGLGDEVHYYSGDNYKACQEAIMQAIDLRIMPDGIEWPRFVDSELVRIGSETDSLRVDEIRFGVGGPGGCTLYQVGPDGLNDRVQAVAVGERVKRPDSWERLEEDAEKLACEYFGREGEKAPCFGCRSREIDPCTAKDCEFNKTIDLVRRAKALAERGWR